jgi:DNA repair protein RadC
MLQETTYTRKRKSNKLSTLHEVEIIYTHPSLGDAVKLTTSKDVYSFLVESVFDKRKIDFKEMFYVLLLNRASLCIGFSQISIGNTFGTVVNFKEIIQLAILGNGAGIIITHNHPSGRSAPSQEDRDVTEKVKAGCKLFEINLLDHIIVSSLGYYSFADEGEI